MKIQDLAPGIGSNKKTKRVGRGEGSGHGKTCTKGHKGQKARSGGTKGAGFEGGQTPLQRRLPKRGFRNSPFKKEYATINLDDIMNFGLEVITPDVLRDENIIKDMKNGLKILGKGNIDKPLNIKAHAFSSSALSKINAAGGKAEVL